MDVKMPSYRIVLPLYPDQIETWALLPNSDKSALLISWWNIGGNHNRNYFCTLTLQMFSYSQENCKHKAIYHWNVSKNLRD